MSREREQSESLSPKQIEKATRDLVIIQALTLRDGWLPDIWLIREGDASRKMMITNEGERVVGEAILKLINKES